MQLITLVSAAAAMISTAHATDLTTAQLNATCNTKEAYARVINRCDYDVNIWSVLRNIGCEPDNMVTLKKGQVYQENLRLPVNKVGVSIKISKTKQCKGNDITQLEYFIQSGGQYEANYLDVSYVDCLGGDCPTMKEGYYLKSGDQVGTASTASAGNTICPVLSCHDAASCSKISYVLPDDVQTRSCPSNQNLEYYLCGGEAPSGDDYSAPAYSQPAQSKPEYKPSTAKPSPSPSSTEIKVNAAAVTPAPAVNEPKPPKVKTTVVYVTEYKYVEAKRHEHAHAHARRHQNFHA